MLNKVIEFVSGAVLLLVVFAVLGAGMNWYKEATRPVPKAPHVPTPSDRRYEYCEGVVRSLADRATLDMRRVPLEDTTDAGWRTAIIARDRTSPNIVVACYFDRENRFLTYTISR